MGYTKVGATRLDCRTWADTRISLLQVSSEPFPTQCYGVTKTARQPNQKRLGVLIADDSATIRNSLCALISCLPAVEVVGLAQTGCESLGVIRSLKPEVAILDIRMPDINGIQVLEAVRNERLKVVVIMLTALDEIEYRRKCLDLGAKHFFNKSTEFEKVIEVVRDQAERLAQSLPVSGLYH